MCSRDQIANSEIQILWGSGCRLFPANQHPLLGRCVEDLRIEFEGTGRNTVIYVGSVGEPCKIRPKGGSRDCGKWTYRGAMGFGFSRPANHSTDVKNNASWFEKMPSTHLQARARVQ